MDVGSTVRRLGLSAVAAAGVVILAAGCSSDSNGTPTAAGNLGFGTGKAPAASASAVAPTGGANGTAGGGNGTPGDANFCRALAKGGLRGMGNVSPGSSSLDRYVAVWQALDDAAPPAIKKDVDVVLTNLKGFASGHPDMANMQTYATALQHIAQYLGSHC